MNGLLKLRKIGQPFTGYWLVKDSSGVMVMKREYPDAPVVAVGAIVLHEGKVLLVKRAQEPAKGLWSIPGGVVELGETVREALKREVKEECGLEIEVGPVFEVVDSIVRDEEGRLRFHYAIIDFLAQPKGGQLCVASDAEAARWFDMQELANLPMPPGTREIIVRALVTKRP